MERQGEKATFSGRKGGYAAFSGEEGGYAALRRLVILAIAPWASFWTSPMS
jgi:hypothetical protein